MKHRPSGLFAALAAWLSITLAQGQTNAPTPQELLGVCLLKVASIIEPATNAPARTWSTTARLSATEGLGDLKDRAIEIAFQAPDHFRFAGRLEGRPLQFGRNGQSLWVAAPEKPFTIVGTNGVPRFAAHPDQLDDTVLAPVRLPMPREQLLVLPFLVQIEPLSDEVVADVRCRVLRVTPLAQAVEALHLPKGQLTLWIRESDQLPSRIRLVDDKAREFTIDLANLKSEEPWPATRWAAPPTAGGATETVALRHVTRFVSAAMSLLDLRIPTLGEATGDRKLVASEGAGRLELQDGTRVLFLKGNPEEMGRQHGALMKREVRALVDRILYGVGVGSSFEKGRWFVGEIESAQARLKPFMDERYVREMDALALTANLETEEVRLANYFPELFHCSGFAVYGKATPDGRLYHGRILDYLRGVGLEPSATLIVHQPDYGYAWVNVGYAGFIGTVSAMNEKKISIGEMGGRGEGDWDGKPMAQLLREVMEKADSLDKAVEILRRGPRTCEYYYVIADGNSRRAVGVAATPSTFELVRPGESHPRLPHAVPDAVLLSAGDRYEKLVERVKAGYGKLGPDESRHLMDRPVAMNSNIHSALFAPETLDLWVANADSAHVASHTRYTHYNLRELLASRAP